PLADAVTLERKPRAALFDDVEIARQIDEVTRAADPLTIKDVELHLTERGGHLVFDDLDARAVAHDGGILPARSGRSLFDGTDSADVEAHRSVELERVSARRRLGAAEHDANLHADLVDEDEEPIGSRDRRGELAERLRHEA